MNTINRLGITSLALIAATLPALAAEQKQAEISVHNMLMDHGDGHLMDMEGGMIMGQNKDRLPEGCSKVAEDKEITVRAGHKYAKKFPGTMFAFDQQEFRVKPCTRLTVRFINEDHIRHQWMMHGLPKYMYDKGMFHLELTGPAEIKGTLILPKEDRTYLVHCDIAQHMEKGMKAQLIVGNGSGTFPSIPGVTDPAIPDDYGPSAAATAAALATTPAPAAAAPSTGAAGDAGSSDSWLSGSMIIGLLIGIVGMPYALRAWQNRFAGLRADEIVRELLARVKGVLDAAIAFVIWAYQEIRRRTAGLQQRP